MTADDFRGVFNSDRNLPVTLFDGSKTLALGLNGDLIVLFKPGGQLEIPAACFELNGFDSGIIQVKQPERRPNVGHSISTNPPGGLR